MALPRVRKRRPAWCRSRSPPPSAKTVPVRIESLGNVTPIASVAIKARVDTSITAVHFRDGAAVKKGDLLFTLDGRAIEAQIAQTEGMVARDRAQLAGAERDVARYTDLVAKSATPVVNLDNAKTQSEVYQAAIKSDQGLLENLKVQLSYCTITAPITGRISAAAVKVGNFVRQADTAADGDHQPDGAGLCQLHCAAEGSARNPSGAGGGNRHHRGDHSRRAKACQRPGDDDREYRRSGDRDGDDPRHHAERGRSALARNPGHHRTDPADREAVVVPSNAVQVSQTGSFVFVINDNVAKVQPVKVERTVGNLSVIGSGLNGGETVVTDGQLLLSNGTRVNPRNAKVAGS